MGSTFYIIHYIKYLGIIQYHLVSTLTFYIIQHFNVCFRMFSYENRNKFTFYNTIKHDIVKISNSYEGGKRKWD